MPNSCPKCEIDSQKNSSCPKLVRHGTYYRSSDGKKIQRYRCQRCKKNYSSATFHPCFQQKKRHKNASVYQLLASLMSQRRVAKVLKINRITVVRKFHFMAEQSEKKFHFDNDQSTKASEIEFDDMETIEHTKCKPVSITLAVETKTRRILGIEVSTMKANGPLVQKAKKYGYRRDGRRDARRRLFQRLDKIVTADCLVKSDMNPHYAPSVSKYLPGRCYKQFKGRRGSLGGQGELKKIGFDPLFSLNHTCAMFRANVNRLIRKTWCTTKDLNCLRAHLFLYAEYHNSKLLKK